jgi:hypothetical protein
VGMQIRCQSFRSRTRNKPEAFPTRDVVRLRTLIIETRRLVGIFFDTLVVEAILMGHVVALSRQAGDHVTMPPRDIKKT